MGRAAPRYDVVVEASHEDKVRALRSLIELYRVRMPERMPALGEDAAMATAPTRHGVEAPTAAPSR